MARALVLGILGIYSWFKVGSLHFFSLSLWCEGIVWVFARIIRLSPHQARFLALILTFTLFAAFMIESGWNHSIVRVMILAGFRFIQKSRGAKRGAWFPLGLAFLVDLVISGSKAYDEFSLVFYILVLVIQGTPFGTPWWVIPFRVSLLFQTFNLLQNHAVLIGPPLVGTVLFPWAVGVAFLNSLLKEKTIELALWCFDQMPVLIAVSSHAIGWGAGFALLITVIPVRKLGCTFALFPILLLLRLSLNDDSKSRVVQWSVGQGDSSLIEAGPIRMMVDVGSARGHFEREWMSRLTRYGVDHVDGILLTHLDEDHAGALKRLLPLVSVSCIQTHPSHWQTQKGGDLKKWLREYYPRTRTSDVSCTPLLRTAWFKSSSSHSHGNELMAGLVFPVSPSMTYFALGDGDFEQERLFLKMFEAEIKNAGYRIWKVGHHGSRYSSSAAFLKQMNADVCWISVGKNGYGHPHPFALKRLNRFCKTIFRTDESGDLLSTSL